MDETMELITRAHQGDKEARELLIKNNLGLVYSIVKRFEGRNVEREDLFQIGTIGLLKAVDRFDPQFDVKFSTYAVPLITGEIKRFFRDDGMIKVSRGIKENGWKIMKIREELSQEMGREPTAAQIAEKSGLSAEEVALAVGACAEVGSLNQPVYQSDGREVFLSDQVEAEEKEDEKLLTRYALEESLKDLDKQERRLILLRYFYDNTQTQVAAKLGITQVQVSRLEKKILLRLREYFLQN